MKEEITLTANEYPIPEGEPNVLSEGTWTHLRCKTKQTSRKFNLNEERQEELYSRLKCAAYVAAVTCYDPVKSKDETYLASVIRNALTDWKKEQFDNRTDAEEWRDRRILYAPSRYGTVAKMIRMVDFDLAKEWLDGDELEFFGRIVSGNGAIKTVGKELGYSDRKSLDMWASIKRKFAKYYGRKAK